MNKKQMIWGAWILIILFAVWYYNTKIKGSASTASSIPPAGSAAANAQATQLPAVTV